MIRLDAANKWLLRSASNKRQENLLNFCSKTGRLKKGDLYSKHCRYDFIEANSIFRYAYCYILKILVVKTLESII